MALACIETMAPDLVCYMIGTNDCIPSTNIPVAAFASNIQTTINPVQVFGDIILITFPPGSSASSPFATQDKYAVAMVQLALQNNITYIDIFSNLVSKAQMTANGMGSDPNHPGIYGNKFIGRNVAAALLSVMA